MRASARAGAVLSAVAAIALMTTPAAAAVQNETTSNGGPIRECFRVSCTERVSVPAGQRVTWSIFANNQEGNRWYFVKWKRSIIVGGDDRPRETKEITTRGWMFCENVAAGC